MTDARSRAGYIQREKEIICRTLELVLADLGGELKLQSLLRQIDAGRKEIETIAPKVYGAEWAEMLKRMRETAEFEHQLLY